MNPKEYLKKTIEFLRKDTWPSMIVSVILIILIIKFMVFPALSLVTGSKLPVVIVESCSMYHESSFDSWWESNSGFYNARGIEKEDFELFTLKNGLNKGDIVIIINNGEYKKGDIIVFQSETKYPLIHRIIEENPIGTKGDHNSDQISLNGKNIEKKIQEERIIGKAVGKVPLLGWIKLIIFELFKDKNQRGFC